MRLALGRHAGALWVALLGVGVAMDCTPPMILEDTVAACRNRYDDDGDGLTDCADPDCAGTSACEGGAVSCRDGTDNDGDGLTDCQETACQAGGFCDAAEAMCTVSPQAGCLAGQGCYATLLPGMTTVTFRCRLAGSGAQGSGCNGDAIDVLTARDPHPCAAGMGCSVLGSPNGACAPYCFADGDCPPGGVCNGGPMAPSRPGICTVPCNPISGLGCFSATTACRSFHEVGNRPFASGGGRFGCFAADLRAGQGRVGDACDDPPNTGSQPSRVCGFGSVCANTGAAARCAASCDVNNPACAGGLTCTALYPGARPSAFGTTLLGYCR